MQATILRVGGGGGGDGSNRPAAPLPAQEEAGEQVEGQQATVPPPPLLEPRSGGWQEEAAERERRNIQRAKLWLSGAIVLVALVVSVVVLVLLVLQTSPSSSSPEAEAEAEAEAESRPSVSPVGAPPPQTPSPTTTSPSFVPTTLSLTTSRPTRSSIPSALPTRNLRPAELQRILSLELPLDTQSSLSLWELPPDSPHYQAFVWLLEEDFEEEEFAWDVVQRFVLALFFFSTNGRMWLHPDAFLDHERHVCRWHLFIACRARIDFDSNPNVVFEEPEEWDLRVTQIDFREWTGGLFVGLEGTLPEDLFWGLPYLYDFTVRDEDLHGTLPQSLGTLKHLSYLEVGVSPRLGGTIPASLANASSLGEVWLDGNQLTGTIPVFGKDTLTHLSFARNQLKGTIPSVFGQFSQLKDLQLQDNALTGTIPTQLGDAPRLESLSLHRNQLEGTVPKSFCNETWKRLAVDCANSTQRMALVTCSCCTRCW